MRLPKMGSFLIVLGALSLIVAACGGGETETPRPTATTAATAAPTTAGATSAPATSTPRPTAPAVPTNTAAPVPAGAMTVAQVSIVALNIYAGGASLDGYQDSMLAADFQGKLDANYSLATSWSPNADSSVWTYKFRDTATFHDGNRATSADAKYTVDIARSEKSLYGKAGPLRRGVAKIETPDPQTMIVTLNAPDIFWPIAYTSAVGGGGLPHLLLPSKYIDSVGVDEANKKPIGTGPFKIQQITVGDRIVLEAVERHWYFGVPRLKTLTHVSVPEEGTRRALLQSGQIDMAPISTASVRPLRAAGIRADAQKDTYIVCYLLRENFVEQYAGYGKNPLASTEVRQALHVYGIDRKAIVESFMSGLATPTTDYPMTPLEVAFKGQTAVPSYDPVKAKAMIAAAGWPQGFEMDLIIFNPPYFPEGGEMAEAIAVMWENIGVKIKRLPQAPNVFRDSIFANVGKQIYSRPTAVGFWSFFSGPNSSSFATTNHDPTSPWVSNRDPKGWELSKAWAESKSIEEYTQRAQAYQQWENANLANFLSLFTNGPIWAVNSKVVPAAWSVGADNASARIKYAAAMRA